jgi:mRNA interferase RelE/StbE
MRPYRVVTGPDVADVVRGLHPELKRSVRSALAALSRDPALGDPLSGELEALSRYRVRRFRVVYAVDRGERVLRVVAVGPRRNVYEELADSRRGRRPPA